MVELTGRVTYRERIALPAAAEIHVELLAVDTCKTVAEVTQVTDGAQVPISFVLSYPADAVDELLGYALRAEIRYDGRAAFVTSDPIPVITQGHPSRDVEIRVRMAA